MKLNKLYEKKGVDYKYSCILYELPEEAADDVMKWGIEHISNDDLYHPGDTYGDNVEYGRENHIHLTVKWGLHDAKPTNFFSMADRWGSFSIELGEVTKFEGSPNYDVIKIDVSGDKLFELNGYISNNLLNTETYPEYHPHVTIAYVKKGSCDHLIGSATFSGMQFNVDSVMWSSHDGKKYAIGLT